MNKKNAENLTLTNGDNSSVVNRDLNSCITNHPFKGNVTVQNGTSTTSILTFTYDGDYELKDNAYKCINTGFQGAIEGAAEVSIPIYDIYAGTSNSSYSFTNTPAIDIDASGYDRTKNFTGDKSSYGYDGLINILGTIEIGHGVTYSASFVTQNGSGVASGANKDNAACAALLQNVLDAAGLYKKNNSTSNVRIKLAKHTYTPTRKEVVDYSATQVWNDDERTYSFFIPRGITLMGGYDTTFDQRATGTNQVVFSGNRLGGSSSPYMYHVVSFTPRIHTCEYKTPP